MSPRKQKKLDDFHLLALDELFRRVGFEKFDRAFTEEQWWYTKREWTSEEDADFKNWFIEQYRKTFRCSKKLASDVANVFVFNYGWKIKKMYDTVDGFVR